MPVGGLLPGQCHVQWRVAKDILIRRGRRARFNQSLNGFDVGAFPAKNMQGRPSMFIALLYFVRMRLDLTS